MKPALTMILPIAFALSAGAAVAAEGKLLDRRNPDWIPIWKSELDLRDGEAIMGAKAEGQTGDILEGLMACKVPSGQAAVTSERTTEFVHVVVVGGDNAGCRGFVRKLVFEVQLP